MSLDFTINAVTTGLKSEKTVARTYILYPAYPNPFNPSTKITYEIPEQSMVKINIYNVLGEEISEPVNNVQSVGTYNFSWNASNLASGFYFLTINAASLQSQNKFTKTIKMILLK